MIHEDRVRQMIKLAVYDENKSMGEKKPAQYFRKDYLALEMIKSFFCGTMAYAIHQSGKWYTDDNIDQMLMARHLNKKARRSSNKNHFKGTKKRTEEDDARFAQSFEKLLLMAQERRESE